MPELPELEVLQRRLLCRIKGKEVEQMCILKPYVLKNYFTRKLAGEKIENIKRRGKYLVIELTEHKIILHLMLRGSIRFLEVPEKIRGSAALVLKFTDGSLLEVSERGHKKRVSVHILAGNESTARLQSLGAEPLASDFTEGLFKELLLKSRQHLKTFLRNQSLIAGIGNAYADEILWHARLSPFKNTVHLDDREAKRLYCAVREVLKRAIREIEKRGGSEKRDFLKIHGRKGFACPRCGEDIQTISYSDSETYYCAKCQTGGRKLKDRRLSKFYR